MGAILVTGGAGYVGSHIVRVLTERGQDVAVVDDLSEGYRAAIGEVRLIESDFSNETMLDEELGSGDVEFLVHMAASCEVGESMENPAKYYANNLTASLRLLEAARRHGVRGIVFSSTAAVYGEPLKTPITEEHPQLPTNAYGETKLAFERALAWYHQAYGVRYVALRYFNAAGAHPDASIGEDHRPESHIVPRLLRGVIEGQEPIPIFGNDWPTPDGTCVRDYVHVVDLAQAHVLAIEAMRSGDAEAEAFNLGNGEGFSVLEVIDAVGKVTGQRPATVDAPRRAGDPATLVASSDRIRQRLGWNPEFPALEEIVSTAWEWHRTHPD
ncbi:MAG: UDP-glucose 4-epimerase GalE, partial [Acidobacteria bacterium]|nr:UDP-glucose 4-epimerase GalE [Acidobacteriota bacterium]NIM60550.1 UDP-glucose 4-epimerase GalE [Acidobacteriota bacterium]NIO59521.1 UDP-glucose 4-epimerase GalE [Acidobacteriota bacterium]NIQ30550.1 UDP-glucose 4-epimerase GalE [Acidobacteriota bacterium]NIQ85498.1 UDP-glucose 4-epimerase GalE [Acidobacteriota bacterium]